MRVFICYSLDDYNGWHGVKLFSTYGLAEQYKKDNVGIQIGELEVDEAAKLMGLPENVKCPECGGEMISRKGAYGVFWGCKRYPSCRGTRDNMGRSREERAKEKERSDSEESERLNGPNKFPFRRS